MTENEIHRRSIRDLIDTLENWVDPDKEPEAHKRLMDEVEERRDEVDAYLRERKVTYVFSTKLLCKLVGLIQYFGGYFFIGFVGASIIHQGEHHSPIYILLTGLLGALSLAAGWTLLKEKQIGYNLTYANLFLQMPVIISPQYAFEFSTFLTASGMIVVDSGLSLTGSLMYLPNLMAESATGVETVTVGLNFVPIIYLYFVNKRRELDYENIEEVIGIKQFNS